MACWRSYTKRFLEFAHGAVLAIIRVVEECDKVRAGESVTALAIGRGPSVCCSLWSGVAISLGQLCAYIRMGWSIRGRLQHSASEFSITYSVVSGHADYHDWCASM